MQPCTASSGEEGDRAGVELDMHRCHKLQRRPIQPHTVQLLTLLLITSSCCHAAQKPAVLLPENQKILAQTATPPSPPGSVDSNGCEANDPNCYDHTRNVGSGNITVSRRFPPADLSPYNYAEVLHKSYLFYYQQRSGKLPFQVSHLLYKPGGCAKGGLMLYRLQIVWHSMPCFCGTPAMPDLLFTGQMDGWLCSAWLCYCSA